MKDKKLLLILFVALYVLFALTGCHKVSPATTEPPGNSIPEEFPSQVNRSEDVASSPPAEPLSMEYGTMPLIDVYSNTAASDDGFWTSRDFVTILDYGTYYRYWFRNNTGEAVRVYVYKETKGRFQLYSSMEVAANDQNSKVFIAAPGTFHITVEAYESGGVIDGEVAMAQYRYHPE